MNSLNEVYDRADKPRHIRRTVFHTLFGKHLRVAVGSNSEFIGRSGSNLLVKVNRRVTEKAWLKNPIGVIEIHFNSHHPGLGIEFG